MNRDSEIDALFTKTKMQLVDIRAEYKKSLDAQNISDLLKVDIKNFFENLRSVLDYSAHSIREKFCPSANPRNRFYFPILPDINSFTSQMNNWYPHLMNTCPDIYNYLESIQPFNSGNEWLGHFNKVNNENKHGTLVEQTRHEEVKKITAKSPVGGEVSWDPSSVTYGSGVFIHGVQVDPATQLPEPSIHQTIEKTIWVDFRFLGINVSALSLIKNTLSGVEKISMELRKHL
jgi:hypothetical protein